MSKFNNFDSLVQGFRRATKVSRYDFYWHMGAIWLDALPTATSDSYGYQLELNPGSLGTSQSL